MGTSPDVGGRAGLGRPLQPEIHELEATAQTINAKQGMALVKNTLEVPLTQLGGNQQYKYLASETKPSMRASVLVGVLRKDPEKPDELQEKLYEELREELPTSLANELAKENKKPAYQRDPPFLVLEQILRFCAKALAFLRRAKEVKVEDHAERSSKMIAIPPSCLWRWKKNVEELMEVWKEADLIVGKDVEKMTAIRANVKILSGLQKKVDQLLNTKEREARKEMILTLADEIDTLDHLYRHKRIPYATVLLGDVLATLKVLLYSLAKERWAPPLFLLGMTGDIYRKTDKMTDGMGKHLDQLLDTLALLPKETTKIEAFHTRRLAEVLCLFFTGVVGEAAGATKPGKISRKETVTGKMRRIRTFAYKLASCLIATNRVLPTVGFEAFRSLALDERDKIGLVTAFSFLSMNIPILAGSRGRDAIKGASYLMAGMGDKLIDHLTILKTFVEGGEGDARKVAIAVREAAMALRKNSEKGYFEGLAAAASLLEIPMDDLCEECENFVTFVIMLVERCHTFDEQNAATSYLRERA